MMTSVVIPEYVSSVTTHDVSVANVATVSSAMMSRFIFFIFFSLSENIDIGERHIGGVN